MIKSKMRFLKFLILKKDISFINKAKKINRYLWNSYIYRKLSIIMNNKLISFNRLFKLIHIDILLMMKFLNKILYVYVFHNLYLYIIN